MHPVTWKKRKHLTLCATQDSKGPCSNVMHSTDKKQKRTEERILLARSSVIKEKYRRLLPAYDTPWQEPPSTATHWDHLLSEATWMWNDLSQERLWKEAVAKQLAYEAVEYYKQRPFSHSSASSSEVAPAVNKNEIFGVPLGRQFRVALQDMVRRRHRKKTMRYEKMLRKFQKEYEVLEQAAIYGFEPDDEFCLLNVKIPTQACIPAPNEIEKDYAVTPQPKVPTSGRPGRLKKSPPVEQLWDLEDVLPSTSMPSNRSRPRNPRSRITPTDTLGTTSRTGSNHRDNRRRVDWNDMRFLPGSSISVSQNEIDTRQDRPTIQDFLARNDDQLLFFAATELNRNWQIVSDVMASAGIYMSPEACRERQESLESSINQAQSQLIRLRAQSGSSQGCMDDLLLKQLRVKAKDVLKKGVPEMMAGKLTKHSCSIHKKRCLKLKDNMREANVDQPTYHISQRKLSDSVLKCMGGRLVTPKQAWTDAANRSMAKQIAVDMRSRQETAAAVQRQLQSRMTSSQAIPNGAQSSVEMMQKSASSQQQGSIASETSWPDPAAWGPAPAGIPAAFIANGSSIGGVAAGHITAPWIPPPADVFKGLPQWPNLMSPVKTPTQPGMEGASVVPPLRPGMNFRNPVPQPLMSVQPGAQDSTLQRRGHPGIQPGPPQPVHVPPYQANRQFLARIIKHCGNSPTKLRQFLQSDDCTPPLRQMIVKTLSNSTGSTMSVNPTMGPHPTGQPQRGGLPPSTPPVVPNGPPPRMPGSMLSSSDPYMTGNHPPAGPTHSSFQPPSMLDHASQLNAARASLVPSPRDLVDPQATANQRSRARHGFSGVGYDLHSQVDPSGMNVDMQTGGTGAMFGMQLRMPGAGSDLMNPGHGNAMDLRPDLPMSNIDARHPLHGMPNDVAAGSLIDAGRALSAGEPSMSDGNYLNESHALNNRTMSSYGRHPSSRTFGK